MTTGHGTARDRLAQARRELGAASQLERMGVNGVGGGAVEAVELRRPTAVGKRARPPASLAALMNRRTFTGSLRPGLGFHAARHVDAPGSDLVDRGGDVLGRQPAGEDHPPSRGDPLRQAPVEHLARPGGGRVDHHRVDAGTRRRAEPGVTSREGLDQERDPLPEDTAASAGVSWPWSWTPRRPACSTTSTMRLGALVAEHADGDRVAREAHGRCRGPCRA